MKYNKTNSEVFIENFFKHLKKKGLTQKQYENDNDLPNTTLSKWKNGSLPSIDQVKKAAEYFGITTNDLLYSSQEKKKIEVFADKEYDPIEAQQTVQIDIFRNYFDKPLKQWLVFCIVFSFLVAINISFQYRYENISYIILLGLPICLMITGKKSLESKTYIINYLDDIFYERKESKNSHYMYSVFVRVISILAIFFYSKIYADIESLDIVSKKILGTFAFSLIILLFGFVLAIVDLSKTYKLEIYDNEIYSYKSEKVFLLAHFCIVSLSILLVIQDFSTFIWILVISAILLGLNSVDFYLVSKSFDKYNLVYQKSDSKPRKLLN